MPTVRFELKISTGERPQTYVLDRAATGTGLTNDYPVKIIYGVCTSKIVVSTDRICKTRWRRISQNYAGGSGYSS